ncbi:unnamed protein product, partial [Urochloa humidicola]
PPPRPLLHRHRLATCRGSTAGGTREAACTCSLNHPSPDPRPRPAPPGPTQLGLEARAQRMAWSRRPWRHAALRRPSSAPRGHGGARPRKGHPRRAAAHLRGFPTGWPNLDGRDSSARTSKVCKSLPLCSQPPLLSLLEVSEEKSAAMDPHQWQGPTRGAGPRQRAWRPTASSFRACFSSTVTMMYDKWRNNLHQPSLSMFLMTTFLRYLAINHLILFLLM